MKQKELGATLSGVAKGTAYEMENLVSSVILGATKALKENKTETKIIGMGILGNVLADALDLDSMLAGIGLDGMGYDSFVDNISDVAMIGAGLSLYNKSMKNAEKIRKSQDSVDEILSDMFGIDISDDEDEKEEEPVIAAPQNPVKPKEVVYTEDQVKLMIAQAIERVNKQKEIKEKDNNNDDTEGKK